MKFYSSMLTYDHFQAIAIRLRSAHRIGDDVYLDRLELRTGRKRRWTYDFHLVSSTKEPGSGRRYPSSGAHGSYAVEQWAATRDEWGWFIAALYDADPDALTATYGTREQFHAATDHRYEG